MTGSGLVPELKTLPQDIYDLFDPAKEHVPDERNLEEFADNLKDILRTRLSARPEVSNPLRFSSLGKPDRQIWMDANPTGDERPLNGKTYFKFLYGDVIECLVLFLAKEAGHVVESPQAEVEVDGVKGHIDAVIDGVVVDVKSAAPHGFKKFLYGDILNDDPFGYVHQLSGYSSVLTPGADAAWVAMDKVSGSLTVSVLSKDVIKDNEPLPRITHLKEVLSNGDAPPPCYHPIPDGKSGNMKLATGCSYCKHINRCWPSARKFLYSTGPRYLTTVVKTPDVPEVTALSAEVDF